MLLHSSSIGIVPIIVNLATFPVYVDGTDARIRVVLGAEVTAMKDRFRHGESHASLQRHVRGDA